MKYNRIKEIREENDLKQREVANIVGVERPSYSSWENGERIIPLKHLNTLSNYYHISTDYLIGLTNKKSYINKEYNFDKKIVGSRIKLLRKNNNLTLRELAKELNTTSSTISAYETGKTTLLTAFAYQICIKYNVSLDYLIGRSDESKTDH